MSPRSEVSPRSPAEGAQPKEPKSVCNTEKPDAVTPTGRGRKWQSFHPAARFL
jgi:hypothetical protein